MQKIVKCRKGRRGDKNFPPAMPKTLKPLAISKCFSNNIEETNQSMHIETSPYFLHSSELKKCHKTASTNEITEVSSYFQTDKQPTSCNCFIYSKQNQKESVDSPYFYLDYSGSIIETKRKKAKRKLGPQLKGFSECDQEEAAMLQMEMELTVMKLEGKLRESEDLSGFSNNDIAKSATICSHAKNVIKQFTRKQLPFKGFSEKDQNKPIKHVTTIFSACDKIKNQIYKTIDKRVLANYKLETEKKQKVVRSRYWRECTASYPIVKSEPNMLIGWNQEIKKEKIKDDEVDRELAIISQIQKLHQELVQIRKKKYSFSVDDIKQQSPFCQTKHELVIPPFVPPKSPHHLLEEDLYHNPWALLVATIFLNKTSGRSARPYVFWFLEENPDPFTVISKKVDELESYFGALGLQRTRAIQVWKMSHDFLYKNWTKARELFGIGKYGDEAFRMFCLGDFTFQPSDRYLKIYKAWYEMQDKEMRLREMNN
ncbi:uncharacterized protein LOC126733623 isoform X2 [Anthonomus grandis grandis]|uniref:uncharacterized protein LOC126733623 isoform X2 n=1 Tax=Anthonomus grandis grandis TaxID=2921223 RepID=UPI0021668D59|nr:uncharacterized protein LOC126733623 isoform X2 [Anthonomus grandis grandis]